MIDSKQLAEDIRKGLSDFKEEIKTEKPTKKERKVLLKKLEAIEDLVQKIKNDILKS